MKPSARLWEHFIVAVVLAVLATEVIMMVGCAVGDRGSVIGVYIPADTQRLNRIEERLRILEKNQP